VGKKKRVLVIGLGRFGVALTEELWRGRAELIVVDNDERAIAEVKDRCDAAFVADATDIAALEGTGVREIDAAVVAFGRNFEAAVLTVSALRKWKVPEIVARATSRERAEVLRAVGATRVHEVETEMGQRAALAIVAPVAPDLLDVASQFRVVPWSADGPLVGKALSDCGIRQNYGINVLGIRPAAEEGVAGSQLRHPTPEYVIRKNDTLLLVGNDDDVNRFVTELGG
jgi:trk system potassium uptake protein TrkA